MISGDPFSKTKKLQSKPNSRQRKPQSLANRYASDSNTTSEQTEKKAAPKLPFKKPPKKESTEPIKKEEENKNTDSLPNFDNPENIDNKLHNDLPLQQKIPIEDIKENNNEPIQQNDLFDNKINSNNIFDDEEDKKPVIEANQNLSKNGIEIDNSENNANSNNNNMDNHIESINAQLIFDSPINENEEIDNKNTNIENEDNNQIKLNSIDNLQLDTAKVNLNEIKENANDTIPASTNDAKPSKSTDANGNEFGIMSNSNSNNSNNSSGQRNIISNAEQSNEIKNKKNLKENEEKENEFLFKSPSIPNNKNENILLNKDSIMNKINANKKDEIEADDVEEISNLLKNNEVYEKEITELKQENSVLKQEAEKSKLLLDSKDNQIKAFQKKIDELLQIQDELKMKILNDFSLKSEVELSKNTIETKNKEIELLEQQNNSLKEENQNLIEFITNYIKNKTYEVDTDINSNMPVNENNIVEIKKDENIMIPMEENKVEKDDFNNINIQIEDSNNAFEKPNFTKEEIVIANPIKNISKSMVQPNIQVVNKPEQKVDELFDEPKKETEDLFNPPTNANDIFNTNEDNQDIDIFTEQDKRKKSCDIEETKVSKLPPKKMNPVKKPLKTIKNNINENNKSSDNDLFGPETEEGKNSLFEIEDKLNKSETLPLPAKPVKNKSNFKKIDPPPKPKLKNKVVANIPPVQKSQNIFDDGEDAKDLFSDDKKAANNLFD